MRAVAASEEKVGTGRGKATGAEQVGPGATDRRLTFQLRTVQRRFRRAGDKVHNGLFRTGLRQQRERVKPESHASGITLMTLARKRTFTDLGQGQQ